MSNNFADIFARLSYKHCAAVARGRYADIFDA